jgi:hypothetical protein
MFTGGRYAVALLVSVCALALAQDRGVTLPASGETLRVRLLAPLTTRFNRKGDMVSARVVEPAALAGGILEGDIRDLKTGGPGKEATIQFQFQTLHVADKALPVTAAVLEVANSKHQSGLDEDGSPLDTGGRSHSGKGAGISRGSEPARLTVKAAAVSFAAGSEFLLQVEPRKAR